MVYEVHITTINKNFTYKVKAENVLEAEDEALIKLKKDKDIKEKASRLGIHHPETGWEVKSIENIP